MFGDCGLTVDELEQHLISCVAALSRVTAGMLPAVRALDRAQVAAADGARSMDEWLSARLDVELGTARSLLAVARAEDQRLDEALDAGVSIDRTVGMLRLIRAGADQATLDRSAGFDMAGLRDLAARRERYTATREQRHFDSRYLHIQPSLDDTTWKLWGQLSGVDGSIVEKAIQTSVDSLPNNPDTSTAQDRADGLVSVASEWLSGEIGGHELDVEIFIDADLATVSDGERGVAVMSGPRVGPATLAEILCDGTVGVTLFDGTSRTVSATPATRTIPHPIRGYVLHRDGHRCTVAGCRSRTRLQPHHIVAYTDGGTHHPDNLVTLCWYHHHVVVHQQGMRLDPDSPPQRRTFLRAAPVRAGP